MICSIFPLFFPATMEILRRGLTGGGEAGYEQNEYRNQGQALSAHPAPSLGRIVPRIRFSGIFWGAASGQSQYHMTCCGLCKL